MLIYLCSRKIVKSAINRSTLTRKGYVVNRVKYKAIKTPKPTVLRICCSDPRFRIAFRDFTAQKLRLQQGEFVPINVAGGPAALAHQTEKSNDFLYLFSQITFFLRHFPSIRRIIVIGHQDCGYYTTIKGRPGRQHPEKKDLPEAVHSLEVIFANITVEAYYASFTDKTHTEIVFEEV